MRIVVTGSSGFIGTRVARAFAGVGHQVVGIARRESCPYATENHLCDVESPAAQEIAASGDFIVHLAGLSDASLSLSQPFLYSRINAGGTLNMLEAARLAGAGFVFASTQRVYRPQPGPLGEDQPPQPGEPYAYSKVVAEKWVEMYRQLYGLRTTVLRLFSVYGPGQVAGRGLSGVVSIFAGRCLAGEDMIVDSRTLRDFTYVDDVIQSIRLAVDLPQAAGRTYNVGTGVGTSLAQVAAIVKEASNSPSKIVLAYLGGEGQNCIADLTKARGELGYAPKVDLQQGLQLYVEWMRAFRQGIAQGAADQGAA